MTLSDLSDADWINPVMVRYFRSRLRSPFFVYGYFLFLLSVCGSVFLVASTAQQSRALAIASTEFIDTLSVLPLLILPIMSFRALSSEIKGDTFDLLLITKLGYKNIIGGAWCTFFTIGVLWQLVLLPVWVLFYFSHGADLVMNFQGMLTTIFISAPWIMKGLWLGSLSSVLGKIFGSGMWMVAYFFSMGISFLIIARFAENSWVVVGILLAHSGFALFMTWQLLDNSLKSRIYPDYVGG